MALGHPIVFHARAADTISTELKCRHCTSTAPAAYNTTSTTYAATSAPTSTTAATHSAAYKYFYYFHYYYQ